MSGARLHNVEGTEFQIKPSGNDFCVSFHADGRIEFGEKYRDNPDAAAQEFMRIVREQWPAAAKSISELHAEIDAIKAKTGK